MPGIDPKASEALQRFLTDTLETTICNRQWYDRWETWLANLELYHIEADEIIRERGGDPDDDDTSLGED